MENKIRDFILQPSETNAYDLVRTLRCMDLHHTTVLIGKFLCELYPNNLYLRSETAISAYYSQNYRLSYELYSKNMEYPILDEWTINDLIKNRSFSMKYITDDFTYYNKELVDVINTRPINPIPIITFTITSCKRFDLFEITINSFLNCCEDVKKIDKWFCVDDNSSIEDREKMKIKYPFFTFYWKTFDEKGHARSMNIIKENVRTEYIFHMEDDWKFFHRRPYITDCMEVLSSDEKLGQCLVNRNYAETLDCNIPGGYPKQTKRGIRYSIHDYIPNGIHCSYWPHYSLRPSLLKKHVLTQIGQFNENASHFEMEYSYRYVNNGFKSCFLDGIFSIHIGRLTSQRDNKDIPNAYDLNNEEQFNKKELIKPKSKINIGSNIKTYVLNLDIRCDRLKKFNQQSLIDFERFSAVNGNLLEPSLQLQRIFEGNDYNMRAGIVGCALSHIKMYIELINSDMDIFLIFEDDIIFNDNFKDQITHLLDIIKNVDWDMIYLGHHLRSASKRNHKDTILPIIEQWDSHRSLQESMGGTFGYLISKKGSKKLLEFINTNGMTNAIDTVQQKSIGVLNTYYCFPHLVFSECVSNTHTDSDIQYNSKSLNLSNNVITVDSNKYIERLKVDGVFNIDDTLQRTLNDISFKYTDDLFVSNVDISMKILRIIFRDKEVKILEIGTYEGQSTIYMLENLCKLPTSSLTSVDPYYSDDKSDFVKNDTYKLFCHNIKLCKQLDKFDHCIDYSYNVLPKMIEDNKKYNIIYLNGGKIMKNVLQDAVYSNSLIQSGGIIVFNAVTNNSDVMNAVKIFLHLHSTEYKIILKDYQWMLQKI